MDPKHLKTQGDVALLFERALGERRGHYRVCNALKLLNNFLLLVHLLIQRLPKSAAKSDATKERRFWLSALIAWLGALIVGYFNQVHVRVTKIYRYNLASCTGSLNRPLKHRNAT